MPTTLTDDPALFVDVVVPAGGDARSNDSQVLLGQTLGNRTRQNKNRIDAIAPSTDGVRKLRTVGSLAALRAIGASDHTDNSYALVEDIGLYRYDLASLLTALDPVIVQPTDVVGGGTPGRWHLIALGRGALDAAYGVPQCDSAGRVPAGSVRNGVVGAASGVGAYVGTTTSQITGTLLTFPGLIAGDLIQVAYSVKLTPTLSQTASVNVEISDPVTGASLLNDTVNLVTYPASAPQLSGVKVGSLGHYTVVNAGTHSVVLKAFPGGYTTQYFDANINATVYRP